MPTACSRIAPLCCGCSQVAALWDELHTKQPWRNAVTSTPGAKPIQPFPQEASACCCWAGRLSAAAAAVVLWSFDRCVCACQLYFVLLGQPARVHSSPCARAGPGSFASSTASNRHICCPFLVQAAEEEDAKRRADGSRLVLFIGINSVRAAGWGFLAKCSPRLKIFE